MDDQTKNLLLASALSFAVIVIWYVLFPPPEPQPGADAPEIVEQATTLPGADPALPSTGASAPQPTEPSAQAPRIAIDTDRLKGSISLRGGRIDDLALRDYRETLDEDAPIVTLLTPDSDVSSYYTSGGWVAAQGISASDVPGPETIWQSVSGDTLTPNSPVTLSWDNSKGVVFNRVISVDEDYLFTITQSATNEGDQEIAMRPYALIRRQGTPQNLKKFFILHEGLIRMSDETLQELDYSDIQDLSVDPRENAPAERIEVTQNGWIGFTDHYWMTSLIPEPGTAFRSTAKYFPTLDIFQAEAVMPAQTLAAGATVSIQTGFFAGAKEWEAIKNYENEGISGFLDSIDWGWFFFLTKPIFAVLHWLNAQIGNMGWAIIGLTLLIKALLFPLAYKSYVSMAKMKELQPEMEKLKKRAGDDRQKLQQEMMALYKKEKVNPAAGCLPILLQIPIFFSLYKVIFVTLELRHAPWIWWIEDLSAPDPSSILNLFGLLPFATPDPNSLLAFVSLGVFPIILGISMWLQQKLNPAPTDATQAMIFAWMPWVFMFMLGSFASGLVLYWIANNMITFSQQYIIMRSQGYKPDILGNITSGMKRKKDSRT